MVALGIGVPALADSGLYTTYTFNGPNAIDLNTCGSTGAEQGCFGGTSLINLNGVCSLLVGPITIKGNTTRQRLYVLQTGSDAAPVVTLKIYTKVVTAQPVMVGPHPSTKVTTTAALLRSVNIPSLKGGAKATCGMVANPTSLFVGTSATVHAVQLDKLKFTAQPFGSGGLHSMTVNEEGYVTVNFNGASPTKYTFGPDGKILSLGGRANPVVVPNQISGIPLN